MKLEHSDGTSLDGLLTINVLVGRNGSGKSRLLRKWSAYARKSDEYNCSYISPERTGVFQHNANVELNDTSSPDWTYGTRAKNQALSFKEVSFLKLKRLKEAFSDRVLTDLKLRGDFNRNFETEYLNDLNALLSNVAIRFEKGKLVIESSDGETIKPDDLSSGEAEAISLASEFMGIFDELKANKINLVFVDEPEAHMHPDLQVRLLGFLVRRWQLLEPHLASNTHLILATHSTSLLAAAMEKEFATIGVKNFENDSVSFSKAHDAIKDSVPYFAHPLSSVFNLEIPLVIEGEDDERVWQQVSRCKGGGFKFFPCLATSVDVQSKMEQFLNEKLPAFYDDPIAISVRDGDGKLEALQDFPVVKRFRLHCYAAENLLLTDEGLSEAGVDWSQFVANAKKWARSDGKLHNQKDMVLRIINCDERYRHKKIKAVRNLIPSICGTTKPWEVVVGRAISKIDTSTDKTSSIFQFLGPELCYALGIVQLVEEAPQS